jgi:hypothetical protein
MKKIKGHIKKVTTPYIKKSPQQDLLMLSEKELRGNTRGTQNPTTE